MSLDGTEIIKEYYWKKMCQLKYDLIYYDFCFKRCITLVRFRKIAFAVLTTIFAGAWMEWNDVSLINRVCPIAMFVLQAVSAGTEFLPHDDRQIELREMMELLEPVYREMEKDWVSIIVSEYTVEEIKELTNKYQTKMDDVKSRFFKNDSLPRYKRITMKAKSETDKYFEAMKMEDN